MVIKLIKRLKEPEYRYAWLLLYWPLFGILFQLLERLPFKEYHSVSAALDAAIPFCPWFAVPYFFWFIYIIGSLSYFLFKDRDTFVRYMLYVMITYTFTLGVYVVYPTSQPLRPVLDGSEPLYPVIHWLYSFDTNTNVCPSLHVIGSFAVMFAAFRCRGFSRGVKIFYAAANAAICASTVFLKQHSVIDVFWGVVVSLAAYPAAFAKNAFCTRFLHGFLGRKEPGAAL